MWNSVEQLCLTIAETNVEIELYIVKQIRCLFLHSYSIPIFPSYLTKSNQIKSKFWENQVSCTLKRFYYFVSFCYPCLSDAFCVQEKYFLILLERWVLDIIAKLHFNALFDPFMNVIYHQVYDEVQMINFISQEL